MDNTDICAICFEPNTRPKWKCKGCNVILHKECIHQWKITNPNYPIFYTCPLCKVKYNLYNCNCVKKNILALNYFVLMGITLTIGYILTLITYIIGIFFIYLFLHKI